MNPDKNGKIFKSLKIGNTFVSTTSISKKELEEYLGFSRIKNAMFEIDSGKEMRIELFQDVQSFQEWKESLQDYGRFMEITLYYTE